MRSLKKEESSRFEGFGQIYAQQWFRKLTFKQTASQEFKVPVVHILTKAVRGARASSGRLRERGPRSSPEAFA